MKTTCNLVPETEGKVVNTVVYNDFPSAHDIDELSDGL
jgi:hypothetical protein